MGARRFGPDTGRFLSRDRYLGALADLGLSADPLTANRYALAAGNPISFVETDGHMVIPDGGGGSTTTTNPDQVVDGWAVALTAERTSDDEARLAYMRGATPRDLYKQEAARATLAADTEPAQEDDGGFLGGVLKGACDFLGPCAIKEAVDEGNWGAVVFETATMVPILKPLKAVKVADNVVDAARTADRATDAAQTSRRWRVGDRIDAPTAAGRDPAWSTVRGRYWKNRADTALEGEFSPADLSRLRRGAAPRHPELDVPMELHHKVPRRAGGGHGQHNLREVWPWEHADLDPFRYYKGPRP